MSPGVTSRPPASISVSPSRPVPISTMRPSAIAMSATAGAAPVPSKTVPPRSTVLVAGVEVASDIAELLHERRHLFECGQHLVARALRQCQHGTGRALAGHVMELGGIGGGAEHTQLDRGGVTADRLAGPFDLGPLVEAVAPGDGHPPVTELGDVRGSTGPGIPAEDHRWMWLPGRLGPRPARFDLHVLTLERGLVLGPDLFHGQHLLAQDRPARGVRRAVLGHLLLVPAVADAEQEPPARQRIDAGDLLGRVDGVALSDEADAGGDVERAGDRCAGAERHERVERAPVELG